jgi:hypothetical protein
MIRRREELQGLAARGVNIPQLTLEQMRRVKQGLGDLFRNEINPLLIKFQPKQDDWHGWWAFEGRTRSPFTGFASTSSARSEEIRRDFTGSGASIRPFRRLVNEKRK